MRSRLLVVGDECLILAPGCMPGKAVTSAMQAVTHHSCRIFSVLPVYASLPWNGHGRIWLLPGSLLVHPPCARGDWCAVQALRQ